MIQRLVAIIGTLLTGACCTSLPKLQEGSRALPSREGSFDVAESLHDWRDPARNRDVPVKMYVPLGESGQESRAPLVIVSHGIGEDRESYAYLGRALASHGYTAVHITHAGTDRATLERGYLHLYRATKDKQNWVNRPLDVSFVLDQLERTRPAGLGPVAIVGHSAGAFTAFAVAGMRSVDDDSLRDARVSVAIPMSMPRIDGVVAAGGYDVIKIPLLNITGTCDTSLVYRTFPRHRRIPFDESRAPNQYLVTIARVNHNSFSNVRDENHDVITSVVLGFLDASMRNDSAAAAWFDEAGAKKLLGKELTVERK